MKVLPIWLPQSFSLFSFTKLPFSLPMAMPTLLSRFLLLMIRSSTVVDDTYWQVVQSDTKESTLNYTCTTDSECTPILLDDLLNNFFKHEVMALNSCNFVDTTTIAYP